MEPKFTKDWIVYNRLLLIRCWCAFMFPHICSFLEVDFALFQTVCGEGLQMNSTSYYRDLSVPFKAQCLFACLNDITCESVTTLNQTWGYKCELYEYTSFQCKKTSHGSSYTLVSDLQLQASY